MCNQLNNNLKNVNNKNMKKRLAIFIIMIGFSNVSIPQVITYQYDNLNRLTKADYGGGVVINYTYDANGNRLTETVNSNSFVNVKMVLNGFYNEPNTELRMNDTVRAYLMNITSPFGTIDSSVARLDSVSLLSLFEFKNAPSGTYYLIIKHRNSIETWSKIGGIVFTRYALMNYDFTSSQSQAYGNNLVQTGNLWGIYSGDVNQDGIIDGTDALQIDNGIMMFLTGYVPADLTGDYFVDATDAAIADNNVRRFITVISP